MKLRQTEQLEKWTQRGFIDLLHLLQVNHQMWDLTEGLYWKRCQCLHVEFLASHHLSLLLVRSTPDWLPLHHSTRHLNKPAWCHTATATGATTTAGAATRHTAFYTSGLPWLHFSGPGWPRLTPANAVIKSTWAFATEGAEPAASRGPTQRRLG